MATHSDDGKVFMEHLLCGGYRKTSACGYSSNLINSRSVTLARPSIVSFHLVAATPPRVSTSMQSDRTWPLPTRRFAMRMNWHDLLFAHWDFPPSVVQNLLPPGLSVDTFDDRAWVAVVPFRMSDVAPRGIPAMPWLSAFPELNVRTYVTIDDKPGVWFFSLDATNPVAVRLARFAFHLPYMDARMNCQFDGTSYQYSSTRTHRGEPPAEFRGTWTPTGDRFLAEPGSLAHFLTARYCLYAADRRGRILRGEIDHPPWTLQNAELTIEENTMLTPLGLQCDGSPHLLFSKDIAVRAWTNDLVS